MNAFRFSLLSGALLANLVGVRAAEVLPYKHTEMNIYPAAQVTTPKGPVIDGNLGDWKPETFIDMYADPSLKETFSLKFALAYDAQGLLVAARFVDQNPMLNHVDPRLDPFKGWNGDALQLRFITDANVTHPVPGHVQNSDSVVHLSTWYYTGAQMPALDVRFGMDFHGAQTFTGEQSGMVYKVVPGGYVQEGRIPWSVMKAKAPQPGQSWLMTMQPLWSNADGKNQHYIFDVVRSAAFQFQGTEGWGKANFIKPADVQSTLVAQVAAEKALFADKTPEVKGAIPVKYNNPQKGFVSLAITNAQGQIVRTLLTKAERNAGPQTEQWDGKDDEGKPVPPGTYNLKALTHPGIKPRYVTSVMNSGNPAWGNSGKYGWGADHGVPMGAASDNEGNTYLVWTFNEGGDYLIQVDSAGQKKWGARISWGDFNGSGQDVVYDNGVLYTAKDGTGHGKIENGKVQGGLFSYDAKTGRARPFPNGQGKMPITNWDQKLASGKHHAANLVALAASPDRIFASLHLENKIVALDKKTFQVAETYNVSEPLGLAYKAANKVLYAVSGDNVVAIDVANGGKVSPFISTGLDHPRKLAFDGAGNLYISTRGQQMQVRVFNPQGKFVRAVGKSGGRPAVGKFDPNGVYQPNGLSIDAKGQLWITETDETPKRISLWNANSGALVKDFYGSTAYAPMMAPDLDNPEQVYLHNTRWIIDYETGKWRPDATMYRQGYLGGEMPQGAEAVFGFMGATFEVATIDGRKYAYNGNGVIYAVEGDRLKPVLHYGLEGHEFPKLKEGEQASQSTRYWIDDDGDGLKDADEVHKIGRVNLGNNIKQFGGTLWPGGVFIKGGKIFAPDGIGQNGVPNYPLPNEAPRILQKDGAMKAYSHWLDVWPSMQSNWKEFYAIASHAHPQGFLSGGGGDSIVRFNRDGDILWRYNRVAVNFGLKAPLAKPGDLYGALRIAGQVQMPEEQGGEIVSIGCYRGYFGFLNEDGLYIDQVGYDNGRGPAPNFDVFFIENFSGYFFQHPRTKKVYLFAGDVDARILELQGWDKIRRFNAGNLQITPAQYQQVIAAGSAQAGSEGAKVLSIVSGTPQLNGNAGWDKAALAEIALDETRKAQVRLSYDQKNLYARFQVPDTSPWQNAEGDWRFAFKGGDAVDIQLGMAGGQGKRTVQPGDVRVMLVPTEDGKSARALAMWSKVPNGMAKEAQLYKSPTGEESFERVAQLANVQSHLQKSKDSYIITAAIPWADLGMTAPAQYAQMQGDVGVLLSDAGGTRTVLRRYLFNQDTAIVLDIPNEVRVVSSNWGNLVFGGTATKVSSSAATTGKLQLRFAGVAGNSGESGKTLLHTALGRGAGGVLLDREKRLFSGGGDRILTLDPAGKLLWETRLPDTSWVLGGPTFAADTKYLYFLAGKPRPFEGSNSLLVNPFNLVDINLCRVEMKPGATVEVLHKPDTFHTQPSSYRSEVSLASNGNGEAFVGFTKATENGGKYLVSKIESDGRLTPLFEANTSGGRVSVDEEGNFYLGGGKKVRKLNRQGQPVPGFASWTLPDLGPVPTNYEGAVMLTKDMIWDFGHYGFVGRYNRDGKPQPGVLGQWMHLLGWVGQIADGPDDTYYIKSNEALYHVKIQDDKIKLLRRFGGVPGMNALMLTANGYIGTGNDRHAGMMWFDFDAKEASSAPLYGDWPGPIAQGFAQGDMAFSYVLNPPWHLREYKPQTKGIKLRRYIPVSTGSERSHDEGKTAGNFDGNIIAATLVGDNIFVIDAAKNQLLRASAERAGQLTPIQSTLSGDAKLSSLAALGNVLLVSAGNTVQALEVAADGTLKALWQMNNFGTGADKTFGSTLHVSASGNQMLLSDTTRQRVLLFSFGENLQQAPQMISQWGQTDVAGEDTAHFNTPTFAAINGSKAAVYDEQNQRVVKLQIR